MLTRKDRGQKNINKISLPSQTGRVSGRRKNKGGERSGRDVFGEVGDSQKVVEDSFRGSWTIIEEKLRYTSLVKTMREVRKQLRKVE